MCVESLKLEISPLRASRKINEVRLKNRAIRTSGEEFRMFGIFLKLQNLTYLHSFAHIFCYKMNLEMRFAPLESRLRELQFGPKYDLIPSPDDL